jgi:hypothetical protein
MGRKRWLSPTRSRKWSRPKTMRLDPSLIGIQACLRLGEAKGRAWLRRLLSCARWIVEHS